MHSVIDTLRDNCKQLQAVDGTSFVASGKRGGVHQWKITGGDDSSRGGGDNDDSSTIASSVTGRSRSRGKSSKGRGKSSVSLDGTDTVGYLSSDEEEEDSDNEDNFRDHDSGEEEGEVDDDGNMTVLPDGTRKKREPKLRAKISTKHIKTMEQIEEVESSMRSTFNSSREILKSIFLLEDTVDGLFSSVRFCLFSAYCLQLQCNTACLIPSFPCPVSHHVSYRKRRKEGGCSVPQAGVPSGTCSADEDELVYSIVLSAFPRGGGAGADDIKALYLRWSCPLLLSVLR